MSCDRIEELLGAYALDALPGDEAAEVERHLSDCRRHDVALEEFRSVAERLALAVPEMRPSASLRERVLDAFDEEASGVGTRTPSRGALPWFVRRPAAGYAIAAVFVLAIAGLVAWNVALQLDGDASSQANVTLMFSEPIGTGRITYVPDEHAGFMDVSLEELPPGRTYQAWALYDDILVSLGVMTARGVAAFEADLSGASALAITDEPAGGSPQPTSDPLVIAMLP